MALPVTNGLVCHIDSDAGGIVSNYGNIGVVPDLSGNGNDFIPDPNYGNNGCLVRTNSPKFGGKTTLLFNGGFLLCTKHTILNNTTDFTVAIVYSSTDKCTVYKDTIWYSTPTGGQGESDFKIGTKYGELGYTPYASNYIDINDGWNTADNSIIRDLRLPCVSLVTCRYAGGITLESKEAKTKTYDVAHDGNSVWLHSKGSRGYNIGSLDRKTNQGEEIAELVIYNRALSEVDRTALMAYLVSKYTIYQGYSFASIPEITTEARGGFSKIRSGVATGTLSFKTEASGYKLEDWSGIGSAKLVFNTVTTTAILAEVDGTSAATLVFKSSAVGKAVSNVTGTSASTLVFIGGASPARVVFKYSSRALFFGSDKSTAAEVYGVDVRCNFNDTLKFDVAVKTDVDRFTSEVDYPENETVINNQSTAGRPLFRQYVRTILAPGCVGSFAHVEIEKKVHHLNGFKFTGFNCHAVPRPGMDAEFISGGSTLMDGWV